MEIIPSGLTSYEIAHEMWEAWHKLPTHPISQFNNY